MWGDFEQHRREIRKPLTPTAAKHANLQLQAMGEGRAIAALRHTIAKGWQGIREPDSASMGSMSQTRSATAAEHLANPWGAPA